MCIIHLNYISYCHAYCSSSRACCVPVNAHLIFNIYCDTKATIIVTTTVVYV